jgi:hypothetical protein
MLRGLLHNHMLHESTLRDGRASRCEPTKHPEEMPLGRVNPFSCDALHTNHSTLYVHALSKASHRTTPCSYIFYLVLPAVLIVRSDIGYIEHIRATPVY